MKKRKYRCKNCADIVDKPIEKCSRCGSKITIEIYEDEIFSKQKVNK